nr:MAG: acyl-CoA desaturase [Hyphomicrobiales bacterium]
MSAEATRVGIIVDPLQVRSNRGLNILSILIPFVGTLGCVAFGIIHGFSVFAWILFAVSFVLTAIGIGVGLHRYFVHRAFSTGNVLRLVLGVLGSSAMQGPIDRWVADHRRHHRFTDQARDPHSPYWIEDRQIRNALFGLIHAHIGWMITGMVSDKRRYAADIIQEPISSWCARNYWPLCAGSLLLPALLGLIAGGAMEALACFLLAGCARVTVLHNITWSVNSIGHMYGSKVSGSKDESRDSVILALLLMGEGLHNYHHLHPSAAINDPWWLDLNGLIISGFEKLGLVTDVVRPRV